MKKIILITILSFLSLSFGIQVSAQETDLPSPGLLPDSPFYFLEIIAEEIVTFFTFGDLKKAERYATLAAERLAEVQAVVEKGKPEFAEKTLARYEMQLENSMARAEKARNKGQNVEEIMTRVGKATSKHLEVLAEVGEKIPEDARPAIENAMKASIKGHTKAVEVLKTKDALGEIPEKVSIPAEVPAEVRERIQTRVQQELEIEKTLEGLESSESLRDLCIREGGPQEICDALPVEIFKSFEQIRAFCMEQGGTTEVCALLEPRCREFGVTTANECFRFLSISSMKAFISTEPKAVPQPSLLEEESEQEEIEIQSFEELEALCLEGGGISPEQCALMESKCKEAGAATADECNRGKDSEGNLIQPLNFSQ